MKKYKIIGSQKSDKVWIDYRLTCSKFTGMPKPCTDEIEESTSIYTIEECDIALYRHRNWYNKLINASYAKYSKIKRKRMQKLFKRSTRLRLEDI